MATTKKPATRPAKSAEKTKTTRTKSGTSPAAAERSKDAEPTLRKAAPKKVTVASTAPEPTASVKAAAKNPRKRGNSTTPTTTDQVSGQDGSIGTKAVGGAAAVAKVALGAVVATAKGVASLASSVKGESKKRTRSK